MKDTGQILDIIDEFNNHILLTNSIFVWFCIINMFPNNVSKYGLKSIHDILELRANTFPPINWI